jgi:hypothetical protein
LLANVLAFMALMLKPKGTDMAVAVGSRFAGRLLILVATICGGAGAIGGVSSLHAQPSTAAVSDLPNDAEARLAVTQMVRQGVMPTRAAGKFAPSEPATLGEYLISLQHLFALPQPQRPVNFTDVTPDSPYYAAVQATAPYLNRQVMCSHCSLSTNLYPEQSLTRSTSIVALVSILNARGALPLVDASRSDQVLEGMDDTKNLGPLARRYVATAISGGLIPVSAAHRAELSQIQVRASAAVILNRAQSKFQVPQVHPADESRIIH